MVYDAYTRLLAVWSCFRRSTTYRGLGRQDLQVNRMRYQLDAKRDYVVLHCFKLGSKAIRVVSYYQVWI
jgi:hypothetical protein